ncbi:serine/arginine repetitive matrix protein 3-like isoform X2 [Chiroxiphia lanceolata]|uniref:serine/arginine repetitive matrix protein 3-like isoform X2 n=1 Tax=Chiroxiphia lanceolata TaxID=296741 RepID=UPI0013CEEAAB|nr:serine/arginine repetitive matrix protein 3-like isoform X2 [Chiroxiphia lanceolata]
MNHTGQPSLRNLFGNSELHQGRAAAQGMKGLAAHRNHIAVAEQEVLKGEKPDGQIHLQTHRGEKVREHSSWTDNRARTAEQGTRAPFKAGLAQAYSTHGFQTARAQRTTPNQVKRHRDRTEPLKRENSTDSLPGQTSLSGSAPRAPPRAEHVPCAGRAPRSGQHPRLAGLGHLRQPPTPPDRPPRAGPFLQAPGTSHPAEGGRDRERRGLPEEGQEGRGCRASDRACHSHAGRGGGRRRRRRKENTAAAPLDTVWAPESCPGQGGGTRTRACLGKVPLGPPHAPGSRLREGKGLPGQHITPCSRLPL